jgi:hypothetical protein
VKNVGFVDELQIRVPTSLKPIPSQTGFNFFFKGT